MVSANISAVINNEMRFFIFSHPLSLIVLNTIGPKRDARRGAEAHGEAPPLSLCEGVGLSLGLFYRDPTTVRQPGHLSN